MVIHRGLSDRKSLQVSRILLNILVNFSTTVFCMFSTGPPVSINSSLLSKLWGLFQTSQLQLASVTFVFHNFFYFSSKVLVSVSVFAFFDFHSVVCYDVKVHYTVIFKKIFLIFIFLNHKVWSCGWDLAICFSQNPQEFSVSIFSEGFGFVHISVGTMVKFKFLA